MTDSDLEIDVCSVDDHVGLTLVAAETYVSTNNKLQERQLVPLTDDDLLTRNKQKLLQAAGKGRSSRNFHNTNNKHAPSNSNHGNRINLGNNKMTAGNRNSITTNKNNNNIINSRNGISPSKNNIGVGKTINSNRNSSKGSSNNNNNNSNNNNNNISISSRNNSGTKITISINNNTYSINKSGKLERKPGKTATLDSNPKEKENSRQLKKLRLINDRTVKNTEKDVKFNCTSTTDQTDTVTHHQNGIGKMRVENLLTCKDEEVVENADDDDVVADEDDELVLDRGVSEHLNRFHFESDHLAIKNNTDYHALLRALATLEAQRSQAIKDLERLHEVQDAALVDPLEFVKSLQAGRLEEFPTRQCVAELPDINWVHYMMTYGGDKYVPQITTRNAVKMQDSCSATGLLTEATGVDTNEEQSLESLYADKLKAKVDGKSATHKQKWSREEQEKLEKLLLLFPPEEVEARRWEKIARALGTRTKEQVQSRIQKYFLKLAKARLPIPGRGPSCTTLKESKKVKMNPINYRNSSFFPSWRPNVYMTENENGEPGAAYTEGDEPMSDEDDTIPDELKNTPEYRELAELKKIRKYRTWKETNESALSSSSCTNQQAHVGFTCDGCKIEPILGVRWHCLQCPSDQSTDFCNDCANKPFTNGVHTEEHQLLPLHKPVETGVDDDYMAFEQRNNKFKYNYLDPNFIPCR